jgi:hypothetical protein
MKRISLILCLLIAFASAAAWAAEDAGVDDADFKVARFVLSKAVEDREPVGITSNFSFDDRQAYAFLEAQDIRENTRVAFVWYYEDEETARLELPLKKGDRWRTYSSKKFGVRKGNWRIDLEDANGTVRKSIKFTVK